MSGSATCAGESCTKDIVPVQNEMNSGEIIQ